MDAVGGGGPGSAASTERWHPLLLEDGEYLFREHAAYWLEGGKRVAGQLKVCSQGLYFVPKDVHYPVFRLPYKSTSGIEGLEERSAAGEDVIEVRASERVDVRSGTRPAPYVLRRGEHCLHFCLVYTSLEEVLPRVQELWELAHRDASKAERAEARAALEELIQEHEAPQAFSAGWLEEEDERVVLELAGASVTPLAAQPGRVALTQRALYFQPFSAGAGGAPIQAHALAAVSAVLPRSYQLEEVGLELFFSSRHSLYLAFRAPADHAAFSAALLRQPALRLDRACSAERWTRDWAAGRVSNFDYLMHLNREAGRSFKDLTQYPVFPWVVADYTSPTLDLSDPATFRDLSRPVGALNPRRLAEFRQRFAELRAMGQPAGGRGGKPPPGAPPPLEMPPFLYGCHYSSPGYVVFYLMRSDPQLMLRLQNGRFDAPDRLFWSVADTWHSVLTLPTDVKELIPEFYSGDPSFLVNTGGVDFGTRAGGEPVRDVQLPPWASDAQDFLYKLAAALESPAVSARLHKWIDLVFGYKSRGARAEAADNVFHYLTYDEVALRYLRQERDPMMREALRLQMTEFGRTPAQLFTRKHPKRRVLAPSRSALACLACMAPAPAPERAPAPAGAANSLLGKGWAGGRGVPPVSRAVFKLMSSRREVRQSMLAWLEAAAAGEEPEALALSQTRGAEVVVLARTARDAREGRDPIPGAPAAEVLGLAVRAFAALAVSCLNCSYLLDAGVLDMLLEAAAGGPPDLAMPALKAVALVSRQDDPRLHSLDARALGGIVQAVRQPPSSEVQLLALTAVANLCQRSVGNRLFFAEQEMAGYLLQQLGNAADALQPSQQQQQRSPVPPDSRPESALSDATLVPPAIAPAAEPQAAEPAVRRNSLSMGRPPPSPADVQQAALVQHQLTALGALLRDDAQKEAVLQAGGLQTLLALCGSEQPGVQPAAYDCLAALTALDAGRQRVCELCLLPMLLQQATSGRAQVQRPAAACVAHICADPTLALGAMQQEPQGLAAVVAMAMSPDGEVQRQAARALWHLTAQPEARSKAVAAGALHALLSLAKAERNPAARELARQGLKQCGDDPWVRPQLAALAAASGVDLQQLAVGTLRPGRSRRSLTSLPSASASPQLSSSTAAAGGPSARHQRMVSEVPSSYSGLSRSSSFKSALDGAQPSTPLPAASPPTPRLVPAIADGAAATINGLANGEASGSSDATGTRRPAALQLDSLPPEPLPIITPVGLDSGGVDSSSSNPVASKLGDQAVAEARPPARRRLQSHPIV